MITFRETLHRDLGQMLSVESILYRGRTKYQDILIFTNETFGKVLVLDGVVQLTEYDNHIYHEMLAHVPLMAHDAPKDVLIIGGGDGGTLREVLKHPVDSAVLVELDSEVTEVSRRFFPDLAEGAFDDPRVSLIFADGASYIRETAKRFDAVIIDSTDPIGPGEALFSDEFYENCRSILRPGARVAIQSGVPFYHSLTLKQTLERLCRHFGSARPLLAPVPTYAHGSLALIVAGNCETFCPPLNILHSRFARLNTRYYAPDVHHAAFVAAPRFGERRA